ncbi:hypothetical protein Droror1_Dr00000118 [Drosera rotundifolia]
MATAFEDDKEDESLKLESDVEFLKRAWQNEKGAPEILEYQSALVRRSSQQIHLLGLVSSGRIWQFLEAVPRKEQRCLESYSGSSFVGKGLFQLGKDYSSWEGIAPQALN